MSDSERGRRDPNERRGQRGKKEKRAVRKQKYHPLRVKVRRQRQRPQQGGGLKSSEVPSRFLNLSNSFEFSGWGTLSHLDLSQDKMRKGEEDLQATRRERSLGQFTAAALAGNDVLGGVFYTLPAVFAIGGV